MASKLRTSHDSLARDSCGCRRLRRSRQTSSADRDEAIDPGDAAEAEVPFAGQIGTTYRGLEGGLSQARRGAGRRTERTCRDPATTWASARAHLRRAVSTPTMDRLAKNGLRYNHVPHHGPVLAHARALLAGRNHHSIGTGVIIEMGTGFPGYTGIMPSTTAGLSEMLRDNGYATAMFGKWHNTPEPDISPAGPFDRWPTGPGASTTSTASTRARRTSTTRCSTATPFRCRSRSRRNRATTSPRT